MNNTMQRKLKLMKNVFVFSILGATMVQRVSGEVKMDYYADFSLKTFFSQPKDFMKITYIDTAFIWDTNYVSDSVNLKLNDWHPTGYLGVTLENGDFNACVELGIGRNVWDAYLSGSETARYVYKYANLYLEARKWYIEWSHSDNFKFLAGKDFTPANFISSNRLLNPMIGYQNIGCLHTGSRPMVQASFFALNKELSAKLAVMGVDTVSIPTFKDGLHGTYTSETILPKFEGSGAYNRTFSESLGLRLLGVGGYQSYKVFSFSDENQKASKDSSLLDIQSHLIGGELGVKTWKFTTTLSGFSGKNLGPYGLKIGTPHVWWRHSFFQYAANYFPKHDSLAADSLSRPRLYNSFVTEWALILNCKITNFLSIEAGYEDIIGNHEHTIMKEDWSNNDNYSWYGQCVVTLYNIVNVSSEVGFTKYGKMNGYGRNTYFGLGFGVIF